MVFVHQEAVKDVLANVTTNFRVMHVDRHKNQELFRRRMQEQIKNSAAYLLRGSRLHFDSHTPFQSSIDTRRTTT